MTIDLYVQSGGEKYVKFAKERLAALGALRADLRLPTMRKHYVPENGVRIDLEASSTGDRIRIFAGKIIGWYYTPFILGERGYFPAKATPPTPKPVKQFVPPSLVWQPSKGNRTAWIELVNNPAVTMNYVFDSAIVNTRPISDLLESIVSPLSYDGRRFLDGGGGVTVTHLEVTKQPNGSNLFTDYTSAWTDSPVVAATLDSTGRSLWQDPVSRIFGIYSFGSIDIPVSITQTAATRRASRVWWDVYHTTGLVNANSWWYVSSDVSFGPTDHNFCVDPTDTFGWRERPVSYTARFVVWKYDAATRTVSEVLSLSSLNNQRFYETNETATHIWAIFDYSSMSVGSKWWGGGWTNNSSGHAIITSHGEVLTAVGETEVIADATETLFPCPDVALGKYHPGNPTPATLQYSAKVFRGATQVAALILKTEGYNFSTVGPFGSSLASVNVQLAPNISGGGVSGSVAGDKLLLIAWYPMSATPNDARLLYYDGLTSLTDIGSLTVGQQTATLTMAGTYLLRTDTATSDTKVYKDGVLVWTFTAMVMVRSEEVDNEFYEIVPTPVLSFKKWTLTQDHKTGLWSASNTALALPLVTTGVPPSTVNETVAGELFAFMPQLPLTP